MSHRDIAILGMGVISPLGNGVSSLWEGCLTGAPSVTEIKRFRIDNLQHKHAALIRELPEVIELASYASIVAIEEALRGLRANSFSFQEQKVGLYVATAHGEGGNLRRANEAISGFECPGSPYEGKPLEQFNWDRILSETMCIDIIRYFGWSEAYYMTVYGACASANLAVGLAIDALEDRLIDIAIVTSCDILARMGQLGFSLLGALTNKTVRPFSAERDGTLIGEAAVAMILGRGADIRNEVPALAKVLGFGVSNDCYHYAHPDPDGKGIEMATREALKDACLNPLDIDAIYLHGSGTILNDLAESRALQRVFGVPSPACTGIKSVLGHSMGAASAVSAICGIMSLQTNLMPPTAGAEPLDPECSLSVVLREPKTLERCSTIMNNGYGFGGINSSLILGSIDNR